MPKAFIELISSTQELVGYHQNSGDTVPSPPVGRTFIEIPVSHPAINNQIRWRVLNKVLVEKTEITLTADKVQIIPDGVDEATIMLAGMTGSVEISLGEGLDEIVLVSDPILVVTSDVPRKFEVRVLDVFHWADPITIEAR